MAPSTQAARGLLSNVNSPIRAAVGWRCQKGGVRNGFQEKTTSDCRWVMPGGGNGLEGRKRLRGGAIAAKGTPRLPPANGKALRRNSRERLRYAASSRSMPYSWEIPTKHEVWSIRFPEI